MTKDLAAKDKKNERFEALFPPNSESSCLLIGCSPGDFSASRIARAVEDCDAPLLNLNVTSLEFDGAAVTVALRVGHRDPSRVIRSLERYGYSVLSVEADSDADSRLLRNYDELMRYLNI